jgi:hypothetical protein
VDTWASDIKLASANGIDGFALNIGSAASFTDTQVANACVSDFSKLTMPSHAVLEQLPSGGTVPSFQAVLQLRYDRDRLRERHRRRIPSQQGYQVQLEPEHAQSQQQGFRQHICRRWLASPRPEPTRPVYADHRLTSSWGVNGWKAQLTAHPTMTGSNSVFFVPSFFTDPTQFGQYKGVIDGMFNVSHCCIESPNGTSTKTLASVQRWMGDRTERQVRIGPNRAGWWYRFGQGLHLGSCGDRCFALLYDCCVPLVLHGLSACAESVLVSLTQVIALRGQHLQQERELTSLLIRLLCLRDRSLSGFTTQTSGCGRAGSSN